MALVLARALSACSPVNHPLWVSRSVTSPNSPSSADNAKTALYQARNNPKGPCQFKWSATNAQNGIQGTQTRESLLDRELGGKKMPCIGPTAKTATVVSAVPSLGPARSIGPSWCPPGSPRFTPVHPQESGLGGLVGNHRNWHSASPEGSGTCARDRAASRAAVPSLGRFRLPHLPPSKLLDWTFRPP